MPFSTNNKIQLVDGSGDPLDTGVGAYGAETLRVTMAADDVLLTSIATNIIDCEALLTTIDSDTGGMLSGINAPVQLGADTHNHNHYGMGCLGVRNDELAAFTLTADGDYSSLQVNALGALYTTGGEVENAAVQSEPTLIGGRFDSSARTLGNGDAGAVALNASGHILMDVVDGGQLDTIIDTLETTLTAIETDQAAIETLLTGIDSDTDAIKTATQLIDDAVAAEDAALGKGILMQGDDGTDRQNLQLVASSGALKVSLDTSGPIGTVGGSSGSLVMQMGVDAKDFDGSALPDSTGSLVEGDLTYPAASTQGVLYNMPVNQDGSKSPIDQTSGQMITTHGITNLVHGTNTDVDTTAEQLDGSTSGLDIACKHVDLQAAEANKGVLYIGGSDAIGGAAGGIALRRGDVYSIDIDNLNQIWVEASVANQALNFIYYT